MFEYTNYPSKLIIAGSEDLSYSHTLEVIFEGVFFVQGYFFEGWHSDTSRPVFLLPELDERYALNVKLGMVQGYTLFVFKAEDQPQDVIIAAEKISYKTDTVLYYERDDLTENQRIANFVKKEM